MPSSLPQQRIAQQRAQQLKEAAAAQTADAGSEYPSLPLSPEENNRVVDASIFSSKPTGLAQARQQVEENAGSILGGVPITSTGENSILGGLKPGEFSRRMTEDLESAAETARLARQKEIVSAPSSNPVISSSTASARVIDRTTAKNNPLFQYANYTYNLSLHVIPIEKYNNLVKTAMYTTDDQTVLIASAGRRGQTFSRHPRFKEDFYFENLKFTTVVGMNSRSKSTNAIDMNFTLIEPYGVTLLDRLLAVADQLKTKSWMQIPFLLQIDFLGNKDSGELMTPIPNQTKYIPIRLIGCKIKVTPKGSEYQISAVPFSHQAYTEVNASTPAFLEVQAKTVGEFFSDTGSAGQAAGILDVKKISGERRESAVRSARADEDQYGTGARSSERIKSATEISAAAESSPYIVGSYAAALNSYQEQLRRHKHQKTIETYRFVFTDPAMAQSKIVIPKKTEAKRTTMAKPNTAEGVAAIRAQAGINTAGLDTNTETFTINAGTNIIEVINMVMRNSEYVRNQFKDPATEGPSGDKKPVNWYKIVPVIELDEFDIKLDRYSKRITYYIEPYTYYNTKFRDAPKALPNYYCKEYQYIYTGKNQSIINFDIDFDTMFYTAITADRSKVSTVAVQTQPEESQDTESKDVSKPVGIQNNVTHPVAAQADMVNSASPDSKGVLINDFAKSMMSSSRGDMITVNLKIIGDPELIKQDDVFYNPANNPNRGQAQLVDPKSNSIVFDAGEVFALLKFKTPVDIDDSTGLAKYESFHTSVFSGVYKIITVDNQFERGQFTQSLQLVRMFDQPDFDTLQGSQIGSENSQNNRVEAPATIAENKAQSRIPDEFAGYDEATALSMASANNAASTTQTALQTVNRQITDKQTIVKSSVEISTTVRDGNNLTITNIKKIRTEITDAPTEVILAGRNALV